jgi:hypothetical protein
VTVFAGGILPAFIAAGIKPAAVCSEAVVQALLPHEYCKGMTVSQTGIEIRADPEPAWQGPAEIVSAP